MPAPQSGPLVVPRGQEFLPLDPLPRKRWNLEWRHLQWAYHVAPVVNSLPGKAGDIKDVGLIPGLGRSPGRGTDNPLQYSCLENPIDRGAWQAWGHKESDTTEATWQALTYSSPSTSHASCPQLTVNWEEEKADRAWTSR